MSIPGEKDRLRAEVRGRLRAMSAGAWAEASLAVARRVRSMESWSHARWIGAYAPMAREIDVWPLVGEALASGVGVAMPGWDEASGTYRFVRVMDMSRDMVDGPHGARVPARGLPCVDVGRLDLVLVPGIAFDAAGGRLGRGKGFYDRLLDGCVGVTCGVCVGEQVVERVPMEPHDARLDWVVFPGGIHGKTTGAGARRLGSGTSD